PPGGEPLMSETVKMPALGESVTEVSVTRWLKWVGETIDVDEPLLEVSTDKVDTEVPSPVAGTVLEILVQEDEDAEVGAVLSVVGDSSGAAPGGQEPSKEVPAAEEPKPAPEAGETKPEPKAGEKKPEGPKAELKQERSAPAPAPKAAGSISGAESSAYGTPQAPAAAAAPAAPAAPELEVSSLRGTEEKMSRIRKITAKRMVESLQTQAQLTTAVEVDMTRIAKLRAQAKDAFLQREGAKLT